MKFLKKYRDYTAKPNAVDELQMENEAVAIVEIEANGAAEEENDVNDADEVIHEGLTCFKCLKVQNNAFELFSHLKYVHNINASTTTQIVCPQCQLAFAHCKTYKRHVRKHHVHVPQLPLHEGGAQFARDNFYMEYEEEGEDSESSSDEECFEGSLQEKMSLFVSHMKFKDLPTSTVKTITENVQDIIASTVNLVKKNIGTMQEEFESGEINQGSFADALELCDSLKCPMECLKSEKSQMEYLLDKGVLILPEEKLLGHCWVASLNKSTGRMEQVRKQEHFQYVPIDKVLKSFLEQPGMMRIILDEVNAVEEIGVLKSYRDGELYKHSFNEDGRDDGLILPLLLYSDEFEPANPLGSRRGAYKLCAFYASVLCLPRKYQSVLSNILLVALVKSKLVTKHGINSVLDVICAELHKIYTTGIVLNCVEFKGRVYPKLFQVIGDNLGLNSMLGFTCGFTANHYCRECRSHRDDCQIQEKEDKDQLRTKENYALDVEIGNLTMTGVARSSSLNNLPYFHVVENSTFDIMHDLLEGMVPLVVKLVLKYLIDERALSLDDLNSRIFSYSYGFTEKQNRPSPITMTSLLNPKGASGQKAAQMNCLINNLCMLIGDKVEQDSEPWQVLLSLLDIYKVLQAPVITVEATFMLKAKIAEHLQLYKAVFEMPLTPKQHFLVHYPRCMRLLGPLNNYTCMRFEAKHKGLKRIARASNNFINIAKTVAKRHQIKQSYGFLLKQDIEQREMEVLGQDVIPASTLQSAETVCTILQCPLYSDVTLANAVILNGYKFRPHTMVLLGWNEDLPKFGEVQEVFILNGIIYLSLQLWATLYFDRHYYAYAVTTTSDDVQVMQANQLGDYRPVHAVQSYDEDDQTYYIVVRYQPA